MASIDVNEILRSSASNAFKAPTMKRPRLEDAPSYANGQSSSGQSAPKNTEEILAALESDESASTVIDEAHIRKLVGVLEKKVLRNREMRVRHPDEPMKFMDSEVELDNAIQEMHCLAAQSDLYEVFIEANGTELLLQLLAHENSDVVCTTIHLLNELIDVDSENENVQGVLHLVNNLALGTVVTTFVTCFEKLDESTKDEADGIHNALSVIENMIDLRSETVDECVQQGLLKWLLKRASQRGTFDANKMYACELLALILQVSDSAKEKVSEADGIDILLRAIATYKKNDPGSKDEREYMENLFNSLCASLLAPANRKKFLQGEGLQLMNLMLREKRQSRQSALKVLDHATTGPEGVENCNKLVDMLGLRTLFPLFLRTPSKVKRKDTSPDEHEEHVCAILSSLLRSCEESARERIVQKFVEHEHEKVDRAVELFLKYTEKIQRFELKRKRQAKEQNSNTDDPDRDYLDKLEAGLYTLQHIALIIADVCVCMTSARLRATKLFAMKLKNDRLDLLLEPVLSEYINNLGDDAADERNRVTKILNAVQAFPNASK